MAGQLDVVLGAYGLANLVEMPGEKKPCGSNNDQNDAARRVVKIDPLQLARVYRSAPNHFQRKPGDELTETGVTVAFDSPLLTVKRIVSTAGSNKQHYSGTSPGLLIALTPVRNITAGRILKAEEVYWAPPSFDLEADSKGAHLLWITLK